MKWKYLKIIICMAIVESGGNLCFYAIQYAINNIGYSFGINNLVLGLT
jgi:C4-dicarboxylate transporter